MSWIRSKTAKLAGAVLLLAVITVGLLVATGVLRYELAGSGKGIFFRFGTREGQMEALDRSRADQAGVTPPEPAPAAAPVKEEAVEASKPAAVVHAGYWTDFRGPRRDGIYGKAIRTDWPAAGLKPLWKQPIGGGYASFVFGDGRAYTIEQRRDKEFVTAYDTKTGKELWAHSYPAFFQETMGGDGPRATPTFHAGRVYSMGATGEMRVLDARTGAVVWAKNILKENDASNLTWGMSASPLVVDDKVIVQPGGSSGNSVVAYHRETGARVWSALDDQQAYTSPMLVTLDGRRQILTVTAKRAVGLEAETGKLIWQYPWVTQYDVNASQPVIVGENRVVITAGYGHGAALLEIKEGKASKIWENNRMKNRFNSAVHYQGHLYGLDEGILSCVRIADGEQVWKGGRYGYGQVLLAGGHLIVLTEQGELALVRATPDRHDEVAKSDAISGKTWNVPAIEDGILFVRNAAEMAAFRLPD